MEKITTKYNNGQFGESYIGTLMYPKWAQTSYVNGDITITEYSYRRVIKKNYYFDKDLNLKEIWDESDSFGKKISRFKDNKLIEYRDKSRGIHEVYQI